MTTSLVYRSAAGYELLMRLLYARHYAARMRVVAEQVPVGASVLELCCGPGTMYRRHLRGRTSAYVGLDVNDRFVAKLRRQGIDARKCDLSRVRPALGRPPGADSAPPPRADEDGGRLPEADVAIMQASLYHFLPDARRIVALMLAAASDRVIISEPVRNLTTSGLPGVARLCSRAADPGIGGHAERFTEPTLDQLMAPHRQQILSSFTIPGGREKVYVLGAGG
ncbi:MAG: class I SAM-dependent methyltransferase [Solirubrobacteraceae bacterium]